MRRWYLHRCECSTIRTLQFACDTCDVSDASRHATTVERGASVSPDAAPDAAPRAPSLTGRRRGDHAEHAVQLVIGTCGEVQPGARVRHAFAERDAPQAIDRERLGRRRHQLAEHLHLLEVDRGCLLYTSDAADERSSVDLG